MHPLKPHRLALILSSALLAAIAVFSLVSFAGTTDEAVLVFSGDENFPPYSFMKGPSPAGFAVDLSKVISAVIKKNIRVRLASPRDFIPELTKGKIDGVVGMPVIHELNKHFSYSIPIMQLDCGIFVLHTNDFVRDIRSLEGTIAAIHKGSVYFDPIKANNPKIKILETADITESFEKLKNGEVTAVLSEKNLAVYEIHDKGIGGIKIVGPPVGPVFDYAIAVKRQDSKLLADINRAVTVLRENGSLDNLQRKWFGVHLAPPFPWKKVSIVVGVITGIMLFLLTGLWVTSLNAAVKIKTDHIQMLSQKMQEKDKLAVLGKLAGQIAHELRTPLSIISNSVFLLRREGAENREAFDRRLSLLEDKVRLTSNILESILSYSRVKAEVASTISVRECLEEVIKDMEINPGIKKTVTIDSPEKLHVFMDFHQLYSVFRNLITNAVQAMKSGGTLSVHAYLAEETGRITVRISDTGTGLSGITSGHIFDLFSTTKITGTGLGLPISKSIAETNGGSLYLESSSPEGSTFVVELPSAESVKKGGNEQT